MGYKRAIDILPNDLLDEIQGYIDGEYLYIPRKECNKKSWGEATQSKQVIIDRNTEIHRKYENGASVKELAVLYSLSDKVIYKILAPARPHN
jgi:Mor family transcriptional regulator